MTHSFVRRVLPALIAACASGCIISPYDREVLDDPASINVQGGVANQDVRVKLCAYDFEKNSWRYLGSTTSGLVGTLPVYGRTLNTQDPRLWTETPTGNLEARLRAWTDGTAGVCNGSSLRPVSKAERDCFYEELDGTFTKEHGWESFKTCTNDYSERDLTLRVRAPDTALNIMSMNVRIGDCLESRDDGQAKLILDEDIDVLGTQEQNNAAASNLHLELIKLVGDTYDRVPGTVNKDGMPWAGELLPIYWNDKRLAFVEQGTLALPYDETCVVNGKRSIRRGAVWVRFKHRATGKQFVVYNTHFDHIQPCNQAEQGAALAAYIRSKHPNDSVIVMGDLNAFYTSNAVRVFETSDMVGSAQGLGFKRVSDALATTWSGFGVEGNFPAIDHMFVSKNLAFAYSKIITEQDPIGIERCGEKPINHYYSDHYPIMTTVMLP